MLADAPVDLSSAASRLTEWVSSGAVSALPLLGAFLAVGLILRVFKNVSFGEDIPDTTDYGNADDYAAWERDREAKWPQAFGPDATDEGYQEYLESLPYEEWKEEMDISDTPDYVPPTAEQLEYREQMVGRIQRAMADYGYDSSVDGGETVKGLDLEEFELDLDSGMLDGTPDGPR